MSECVPQFPEASTDVGGDPLNAGEQLAQFGEVEFGDVNRLLKVELAFARRTETGEDPDVLLTRLDVTSQSKTVTIAGSKANDLIGKKCCDQTLEIIQVGIPGLLVPCGG